MKNFQGKRGIILGVANERSIAWAIAQELHTRGAELAFTYVNEAIEKRVRPLAAELGVTKIYPCDVQKDADLDALKVAVSNDWDGIDFVVHAIAYAEKEDMACKIRDIRRSGFQLALDVSAYSLIGVCGRFADLLAVRKGSVLTLTYLGSERVVPNYNVMGIAKAALEASVRYLAWDMGEQGVRVNAISSGPIKTLAASGIPHFKDMLNAFAEKAPLRRTVTQEDVGKAATFFLSDDAAGVTGEISYVDAGFNTMGF